jgi:hypothetical protein
VVVAARDALIGEHQVRRLWLRPDCAFADGAGVGPVFAHVPVHPEDPVGVFAIVGHEAVGVHIDGYLRSVADDLKSEAAGVVAGCEAFAAEPLYEFPCLFPLAHQSSAPFGCSM